MVTFLPRMLKTVKLLAMTPVATVLWFGALGGMVWRLEGDVSGRTDVGSVVGGWVHGKPKFPFLMCGGVLIPTVDCVVGPDGQRHIRTFAIAELGIPTTEYSPPLSEVDRENALQSSWVYLNYVGERGLCGLTEEVWRVSGGQRFRGREIEYSDLTPQAVEAIAEIPELRGVAHAIYPAVLESSTTGKPAYATFTRPLWSGYIYNGVMVVLLLVGLHSMRWAYRGVPLRQLRQVWRPDGSCVSCGYSLVGLNAAKCPECGAEPELKETN